MAQEKNRAIFITHFLSQICLLHLAQCFLRCRVKALLQVPCHSSFFEIYLKTFIRGRKYRGEGGVCHTQPESNFKDATFSCGGQ